MKKKTKNTVWFIVYGVSTLFFGSLMGDDMGVFNIALGVVVVFNIKEMYRLYKEENPSK